jgi:hypothetical protein
LTLGSVIDIAQVISMAAALAAAWYARQTVAESHVLRREERIARLLDLVADFGETGTRVARGQVGENLLEVAGLRLRAAITAAEEPLPECERLLDVEWPRYGSDTEAVEHEREALAAVKTALDEVAVRLSTSGRKASGGLK